MIRHEKTNLPHIYLIVNHLTGRKYVGQHCGKNLNYFCSGVYIKNSIRKHGKNNFSRIILEEGKFTPEQLDVLETKHIKSQNCVVPKGYNIAAEGNGRYSYNRVPWNKGGNCYTDEMRQKMSESHTGKTLEPEHKAKIGDSMRGVPKNYLSGKAKAVEVLIEDEWVMFESGSHAARDLNLDPSTVAKVCKGYKNMSQTKGYKIRNYETTT
tara:strand:+ start:8728 stop:9357 length:630 start_codon:yes stop_codon:yes gene_type:complete